MTRWCYRIIGSLSLVGAVGCASSQADSIAPQTPMTVEVVQPKRGDAVRSIPLPGDVVGFYEAALYAKVSGYLKSIAVDKGDTVTRGQVLAEIEVPELQQKLKRARASLEIHRLTRERLEHVWNTDKRLVAREDVDIAESKFEEAQADVEELEAMMSYTHLVAPFDAVVTGRFVDPGALIQASGSQIKSGTNESAPGKGQSNPVVTIADISKLRVYVYVPENETSAIREGMPASLTLKEFPDRQFTGTVARFTRALDLSTRTMLTEVDLENPQHELYPGMYADVRLDLARHPDVLQLPTTAIDVAGGNQFVYVVRDDHLVKKAVTLGIAMEGWVEITSGIDGSEQVVKNLSPALKEGDVVQALSSPTDAGSDLARVARTHPGS